MPNPTDPIEEIRRWHALTGELGRSLRAWQDVETLLREVDRLRAEVERKSAGRPQT